jgi:cell fate regulator YaaT (PSP1 superfamily)
MTLIQVRFPGIGKSFAYSLGSRSYLRGDYVLAPTDKGVSLGYISSFPYLPKGNVGLDKIKPIHRKATEADIQTEQEKYQEEMTIKQECLVIVQEMKLPISLSHVVLQNSKKKILLHFTAEEKIDFREFLKKLTAHFHKSIELRHFMARERASSVGGLGSCGLELCCSSFLKNYGHVPMKTLKNQNLSLSNNRYNGVCGVLKCCLNYENDQYSDQKNKIPNVGALIETKSGVQGRIEKVYLLEEYFELLVPPQSLKKFYFSEYSKVITAELIFEGKILEQEVQPIEGSSSIQFSQTPEEIAVEFVNEFFEKDIL